MGEMTIINSFNIPSIFHSFIKKVPTEVILKINRAVGFKLVTKFGEKGIVNLGKAVPVLGGLISGAVDYAAADTVGNAAKKIFIG